MDDRNEDGDGNTERLVQVWVRGVTGLLDGRLVWDDGDGGAGWAGVIAVVDGIAAFGRSLFVTVFGVTKLLGCVNVYGDGWFQWRLGEYVWFCCDIENGGRK